MVVTKCFWPDMFARPILSWTWLISKSKCLGSDMFARPILPHSLRRAKGGWLFSRAYLMKDGHSLGRAQWRMVVTLDLTNC